MSIMYIIYDEIAVGPKWRLYNTPPNPPNRSCLFGRYELVHTPKSPDGHQNGKSCHTMGQKVQFLH